MQSELPPGEMIGGGAGGSARILSRLLPLLLFILLKTYLIQRGVSIYTYCITADAFCSSLFKVCVCVCSVFKVE